MMCAWPTYSSNVRGRIRAAKGVPELVLDGWSNPPSYDQPRRVLSWGLDAHSTEGPVINLFTNVLGRRGYLVIDLIASPDGLAARIDDPFATVWLAERERSIVAVGQTTRPGHAEGAGKITLNYVVPAALQFDPNKRGLVLLTLVAMSVLFASIYKGLLGDPEMQVRGNGSSLDDLRWFQDRSEGSLPTPWVLSVPILVYRGLMLAWALWTAASSGATAASDCSAPASG